MKILDFFSSPIGLGHVTRDIAIVNYFQNDSINFVTGGGAAKILKNLKYSVSDKYNPPLFEIKKGVLQNSTKWLWNYYKYYKECKNISRIVLNAENPNLVISDEDFASLSIAQEMKIPSVLITDVLKTKFTKGVVSIIEKKMNESMQKIIDKCDVVIIPENGKSEDNIKRVGPIVRQINESREKLREKFSFTKKTILISVGGTNAGLFLIEKSLEVISTINLDIETILVSGPTINKKFENVKNMGFVNNLHELIFAADVVISMAGKSTIDEANTYGTPSIFIPIKGHFEQENNAEKQGFVFEDIERLKELILEKIEQKRNQEKTEGAVKASKIIKKIFS
jgi:UDP-N-acetylglucosamine--N-acetylmuramyl-(pentapeptide) pyrophosphoryl-undecaprenol N-acetylglucosamine transferase